MHVISTLVDDFNYISMDTEFPGTVYLPPILQNQDIPHDFEYQMIKANCDNLKLIQVGISLSNQHGQFPKGKPTAWQFNLQFDEDNEQSVQDSMKLLKDSGLQFEKHKSDGIPHHVFAAYLVQSGLILNSRNHWITFHGGMDFGYLLKLLMGAKLPPNYDDFKLELDKFFINYYDCKEIKKEISSLSGGLKQLARDLGVERVGTMHQAGSDAQVTLEVYFKLRSKLKQTWLIDSDQKLEDKIKGKVYGIQDIIFNEEQYIDQYKHEATLLDFKDQTGCVNRSKYFQSQANPTAKRTTPTEQDAAKQPFHMLQIEQSHQQFIPQFPNQQQHISIGNLMPNNGYDSNLARQGMVPGNLNYQYQSLSGLG
mmetsp:Transcript_6157/g.10451  ORF Transcript_6157/g.10451 Transcript_6157/m.10451 type:complete len:367 (+) Transcript_6157:304-1404(+)